MTKLAKEINMAALHIYKIVEPNQDFLINFFFPVDVI